MNIFLTGEKQIGKSTVLLRALHGIPHASGLRTVVASDPFTREKRLYLMAYTQPYPLPSQAVARYVGEHPQPIPGAFDRIGVPLLMQSRLAQGPVIMDELGRLEKEAFAFQNEVIACLDSPQPVLGVVAASAGSWTDSIRARPDVRILTVTSANREKLPGVIRDILSLPRLE